MFDRLSLGVTDLARSIAFYDAVLKPLDVEGMFVMCDRSIAAYGRSCGMTFWLYAKDETNSQTTNNQQPATNPSGGARSFADYKFRRVAPQLTTNNQQRIKNCIYRVSQ